MKVINSRSLIFTFLFLVSMASFLYLELGYGEGTKMAAAEKKLLNSENILENSEKKFHDFSIAKIIISNIVDVIIIK